MEISIPVARHAIEAHYAEKYVSSISLPNDAEVLRVYHNLQKELEEAKQFIWKEVTVCGMTAKQAFWADTGEPVVPLEQSPQIP